MIRFLLFMLIFMGVAHAQNQYYFIKLGSFKQLKGLERSINRLPQPLREQVVVVESNHWFIPFAYHSPNKNILRKKLSGYKRYFPDAHINHSPTILHHPVIHDYRLKKRTQEPPLYIPSNNPNYLQNVAISEEDNTLPYTITSAPIITPITYTPIPTPSQKRVKVVHNNEKYFSKKMLSGKYYYLAYKKTNSSPSLLVKVKFGNHRVKYQAVIGEMQLLDANYLVKNKKLYMYATTFSAEGAYSLIEENRKEYILVSSWSNGKKLNTLRYYYRLNDAKNYLKSGDASKDSLATTLQESEFEGVYLPIDSD